MNTHQKIDVFFICVLGAIFLFCCYHIVTILYDYYTADKLYTGAEESYLSEEDTDADSQADGTIFVVDFDALQAINPEVVAWIVVDGTDISYPVVKGSDNDKYLDIAYDGTKSSSGSIFMNCYNNADFSDANTLIYGHHMRNGSMFGGLMEFEDPAYLNEHRTFTIYTPNGNYHYDIFAAYVTYSASSAYDYSFTYSWDYYEWLEECKGNSIADMGITLYQDDKVVTLSTCTSRGKRAERFVVQGKLRK